MTFRPESRRIWHLRPAKDSADHGGHYGASSFGPRPLFGRRSASLIFSGSDYVRPRGSTTSRIGFEVAGAENYEHHRGQRGLLSLLHASDPTSDDLLPKTRLSRRKNENRLQDADWSETTKTLLSRRKASFWGTTIVLVPQKPLETI